MHGRVADTYRRSIRPEELISGACVEGTSSIEHFGRLVYPDAPMRANAAGVREEHPFSKKSKLENGRKCRYGYDDGRKQSTANTQPASMCVCVSNDDVDFDAVRHDGNAAHMAARHRTCIVCLTISPLHFFLIHSRVVCVRGMCVGEMRVLRQISTSTLLWAGGL